MSEASHSAAAATSSALLFLYAKVLNVRLPWMNDIGRPGEQRRLFVVLTHSEVAATLCAMQGGHRLLAALLYGVGIRLLDGLQLRVKDLDFGHQALLVRQGKGSKDRVVMLPVSPVPKLTVQLDVAATMRFIHVLKLGGGAVHSPMDAVDLGRWARAAVLGVVGKWTACGRVRLFDRAPHSCR